MNPVDVLFIGPAWATCWGALAVRSRGLSAHVLAVADKLAPEGIFVYEGNGEARAKSEQVFGKERTDSLWRLSNKNFNAAKAIGRTAHSLLNEGGAKWDGGSLEPGLVLRRATLEQFLAAQIGEAATRASWDWRIHKKGAFDYQVGTVRAKTICLVGDSFRPEISPFFGDKWIACTFSSFLYSHRAIPPASGFLFNGGADFAVKEAEYLRAGSFRNLYTDRGIGFQNIPDEVTRQNVERFFQERGWISPPEVAARLEVGTVTCDGLPLVGALPEDPGIFVAGGFAGRQANFLFAVLEILADALAGRGLDPGLEPYSTKRFT